MNNLNLLLVPSAAGVISNPLRTADNSAFCTPAAYGFSVCETGGGCMAWRLDLADGGYLLVTDADGSYLPQPDDEESPLFGRYDAEGEELAMCDDFAALPANVEA